MSAPTTPDPSGDRPHVGLRLHTLTPITPRWLARRVLPLVDELTQRHGAVHVRLQQGWLHGPHVELTAYRGRRGPLPWQQIADGWDAGPADAERALTKRAYLDQARALGRMERVAPPYLPLREHGTAWPLTDGERTAPWPGVLGELREYALARLLGPVRRTVASLADAPQEALERAAEAFVAVAEAHPYGAAYGAFSFRSHAEAFFNSTAESSGSQSARAQSPRAAFAHRLEGDRTRLEAVVRLALEGGETPTASAWRGAIAYCAGLFESAAVRGDVDAADLAELAGPHDDGGRAPSPFHQAVAAADAVDGGAAWFTGYRTVINLFYRQLPLLGVSPLQRFYLCHAIAECIDGVLGETWQQRLERRASPASTV
ncbi:hypothetical protein [Streptomyces tibetensis]|uniref:hypothetical protein n=1 Tax=Streptomyces tibetensis TaxID=2382123 RepID=UPI0033C43352